MAIVNRVDSVLDEIKKRGWFVSIERFAYLPVDMAEELMIVEAIGKSRHPKFRIDNENRFTYENFIRWVRGCPQMKCLDPNTKKIINGDIYRGIYIGGQTGTGKSWALEIMSAYAMTGKGHINIGGEKKCLHWENIRTDVMCDTYSKTGEINIYKNMTFLGIQDLGSEQNESMYMGNRMNVMRQILEYRGDFTDKLTFITSNLPMGHPSFIKMYGDRVGSRLNEMCNYFEIRGTDRRQINL